MIAIVFYMCRFMVIHFVSTGVCMNIDQDAILKALKKILHLQELKITVDFPYVSHSKLVVRHHINKGFYIPIGVLVEFFAKKRTTLGTCQQYT